MSIAGCSSAANYRDDTSEYGEPVGDITDSLDLINPNDLL